MSAVPPPLWSRLSALTLPAGDVPLSDYVQQRIDWSQEIPASLLRGTVTAATLAVGQLALGERDEHAIARRAVAGAVIAEAGVIATRIVSVVAERPATDRSTLEGLLLYGDETVVQYAAAFLAARRGRLVQR